ncbi:hypothetical protein GCM10022258_42490 [Aquimarina gracilis]
MFLFLTFSTRAQKNTSSSGVISNEHYEVYNSLYNYPYDIKPKIYQRTFFDSSWSLYFDPRVFEYAKKNSGLASKISYENLRETLNDDMLLKIKRKIIYTKKAIKLDTKRFKNVKLVSHFDRFQDLNDVYRLSKPVIVDNISVFRTLNPHNSSIYIFFKEEGKWNLAYEIVLWVSTFD